MWKKIIDLIPKVFTLAQRVERQEKTLDQHSAEIKDLYKLVYHLMYENQRMQDEMHRQASHEAGEREKLILRLENRLLREKLKLPPRTEDKQDNDET